MSKVSVLIVEDSYTDRKLLRNYFEDKGFSILGEAINGLHAVLMYEDLKPDLVTMDIIMESKDGLLGIEKILEIDKEAKILVVTSVRDKEKVMKALDLGATAYILKPFEELKLEYTLKKMGFE